ncbi:MAG: DUF4861 domain-containing protein [Muribaculaceae bacterium]|nr:DUF4861 domain-containing protein [Muribaculaceae bacterium]
MKTYTSLSLLLMAGIACPAYAQCDTPQKSCCGKNTDAYIKLYDHHNKHPRINSITYPGDANNLDMYNSIYGHGAVIENPWVAYRVYMDNRQSLDLYVKQVPQTELDITGFYTTPEQMSQGYGCDVLWAGKSVAAGSFRGWDGKNPLTIDSVASRSQTVPDRKTVVVKDENWNYNGHDIDMTQKYTVCGNSRDLDVEITLEGYSPDDLFCTGIQKLEMKNQGFIKPEGYAASWGENIPDKNHPELVEGVGLGIIVAPENIVKTIEDDLNYLVIVRPDNNGKIRYKVIATGSREKNGFKSYKEWADYITGRFKNK